MSGLYKYDMAMSTYYKKMSGYALPLQSWEFYGEHLESLGEFKDDIATLKKITKNWDFTRDYYKEFIEEKSVIVVTNADLKIVYVSHNIEKLNGYSPNEVIGNSPKMFQGKETCSKTSKIVRMAVNEKAPFEVSLLNYRKDQTTYTCLIKGFPICDKRGKLINYIAFEKAA